MPMTGESLVRPHWFTPSMLMLATVLFKGYNGVVA